jgi:septal ring factor EnvC (AmiA/AmiB activator)
MHLIGACCLALAGVAFAADPVPGTTPNPKPTPAQPVKPAAKASPKVGQKAVPKAAPKAGSHLQAKAAKAKRAVVRKPAVQASVAPSLPPLPDPETVKEQQREQAAQRDELVNRLGALKREIAASEASRSEAADALAESERAISEINRKLHELGEQQGAVEARLGAIGVRRVTTNRAMAAKQADLARMLQEQYMAGPDDPLKLLLSGDDPSRIQRELHYRDYVSQAQAALLVRLQADLADLADLATQAEQQNEILAGIQSDQKEQRTDLVRQQQARREALAQVSEKLEAQRVQAGVLERDERRLSQVVDELGRLIERQARESREREKQRAAVREKQLEQARRAAAEGPAPKLPPTPPTATPAGPGEALPPIAYAGNFAALRGKLRLPVRGDISGRFGSARSGGGPTWKGVFVRADAGSEVHAIAPGRVVFAEWLRGFGNLLIIDHGEEYLSIYGNNESLLKQPGDSVQGGEVVATVGNSGGIEQTGLYFEMRYQGKPFDPAVWAAPR